MIQLSRLVIKLSKLVIKLPFARSVSDSTFEVSDKTTLFKVR